jgi:hypothetical protein
MKRILILIIGLIGVAYGQYSPTSAKTRFVNGLALGTKLDSYFNAADSNAIYWRADSVVMAKYKGTARRLLFASDSSIYLTNVVRTFGTQTVGGNKTFSNDIVVNGVGVGRGGGSILTNTLVGGLSMASNTTGEQNAVFGFEAMKFNTIGSQNSVLGYTALSNNISGGENTVVGHSSMFYNTSGAQNTAIGDGALLENRASNENTAVGYSSLYYNRAGAKNTAIGVYSGGNTLPNRNQSGSNNTYIGYLTAPSDTANTNETVIGYNATGNGSNTVTIGNSSVTDNYFSGNVVLQAATDSSDYTKGIRFPYNPFGGTGDSSGIRLYSFNGSGEGQIFEFYLGNDVGAPGTTEYFNFKTKNGLAPSNDGVRVNGNIVLNSANYGSYSLFNGLGSFLGSLGVGTTTPTIYSSGFDKTIGVQSTAGYSAIQLAGSSGQGGEIDFGDSSIRHAAIASLTGSTLGFYVNPTNSGISLSEAGKILSNGDFYMNNVYTATVGGTNRDVFVDNTGLIGYVSSFRASKKNIAPISNADWLHKLNPVTFNYRVKDSTGNYTDSAYKELEYGLVAEEVETVNPEMVFYDVDSLGNKKLRGVHYSKLIIPLLAEVKEHKKKLDAQDKIIEALLTRIQKLEAKLN